MQNKDLFQDSSVEPKIIKGTLCNLLREYWNEVHLLTEMPIDPERFVEQFLNKESEYHEEPSVFRRLLKHFNDDC